MTAHPEQDAMEVLKTFWGPEALNDAEMRLPVDPAVIAANLGITVYVAGLSEGVSGMLVKRGDEPTAIYLQAGDGLNRRRFTCAHEIGHYFSRSRAGDREMEYVERRDLLSQRGRDPEEIYANQFAANLLMPRAVVLHRLRWVGYATLAQELGVSNEAMRFRLQNLGVATPA